MFCMITKVRCLMKTKSTNVICQNTPINHPSIAQLNCACMKQFFRQIRMLPEIDRAIIQPGRQHSPVRRESYAPYPDVVSNRRAILKLIAVSLTRILCHEPNRRGHPIS